MGVRYKTCVSNESRVVKVHLMDGDQLFALLGHSALYPELAAVLDTLGIRPNPLRNNLVSNYHREAGIYFEFELREPFSAMYGKPKSVLAPDRYHELILYDVTFHGWATTGPLAVRLPFGLQSGDDVATVMRKIGSEPFSCDVSEDGFPFWFARSKRAILVHFDDDRRLSWVRARCPAKAMRKEIRQAKPPRVVKVTKEARAHMATARDAFMRLVPVAHATRWGEIADLLVGGLSEVDCAEEYRLLLPHRAFSAALKVGLDDGSLVPTIPLVRAIERLLNDVYGAVGFSSPTMTVERFHLWSTWPIAEDE